MDGQLERAAYVVPSYQAPGGAAWYHFLHGNVPGHQIDFIYRAEVPQGPLTRQHFSHLARLMKYIEPQSNERFAFSIGNLSRDDTQYEAGHGGMALIFGLRIHGATDHAGRQDPPFAHAIAAIDRALDYPTLIASAVAFHRHVLGAAESAEWYRAYVEGAQADPGSVRGVLESYVARFADLPEPAESAYAPAWVTGGNAQPRRIVIAHDDETSFGEVAAAAARIAAMLYRSDIRWTAISNGREDDVPGGVSIRLLARGELGPADAAAIVHDLAKLPDDEVELASLLFSADPVSSEVKKPRGWRERYSEVESPPPPADPGRPAGRPGRGRVLRGEEEISVDIEIDGRISSDPGPLPPVRRSAPGAPAPAPALAPVAVIAPAMASTPEERVDPDAATAVAPLRTPPVSVRPKPASEPPAGDRAAIFEAPIPPAPRVPDPEEVPPAPVAAPAVAASPPAPAPPPVAAAAPVPAAAPIPAAAPLPVVPDPAVAARPAPPVAPSLPKSPEPAAEPTGSRRTLWLVLAGLCVAAVVTVVLLAARADAPAETPGSASAVTTAPPLPPDPPAPVSASSPATAPVPLPSVAASPSPTAPAARASAAPSTRPSTKRPPRSKPTSPVLGGSLDGP